VSADALPLRGEQGRRILQLYQLYRLVISSALALLVFSDMHDELLQLANPELFRNGSWLYLALNCLTLALVRRPTHLAQVFALALVDVTLLSALFYAGGGTPSGIGNLLIVAVAIANILLRGRIGLLIAALAAIGMIFLTFYLSLNRPAASAQYVQVGALGALCFAAALFVQGLTRRLQASESLAEQRAADVANLEALNALILQRMRTGILVLDEQHRVLSRAAPDRARRASAALHLPSAVRHPADEQRYPCR
jgi:two-component system sensor histidine kinase PilS (NtrC family)